MEYSRVDDHSIVICNRDPNHGPTMSWAGRSGNYWLTGSSDRSSQVSAFADQRQHLVHFDIRGIGIGFCGDFKLATPVEKLISNRKYPYNTLVKNPKNIYRLSCESQSCTTIDFDSTLGLWPVRSTFPGVCDWDIKIEKVRGHFVPTFFTLKCFERSKTLQIYHVSVKWDSINQSFSVGRDCAKRLAEEFKVELIAPNDKKLKEDASIIKQKAG